jgi:alanine dehydrogenase
MRCVLVLSDDDVQGLLDRHALVEAVAAGLAALSAGTASMPPRVAATVAPHHALLVAMPGFLGGAPPGDAILGAKLVSVFPGNAGTPWPTHQGVIVLFDPATGAPDALVAATVLTAERTAAVSALATRLLADPRAEVLAVLGTGVQARAHALAVARVCPALAEIRIAGRSRAKAEALAGELAPLLAVPARAEETVAEALAGAGVVCACTSSPDPVVRRQWLSPGVHVNSVGFTVEGREVDAATVAEALVVVESRSAALAPFPAGANDLLWPLRDGLIGADHVSTELGELVLATKAGRTSPTEITLFKSVGIAVEDLAAASLVVTAARAQRVGIQVEI